MTVVRPEVRSPVGGKGGRNDERSAWRYWTARPGDVHSTSLWSRFGHVNRQLTTAVVELVNRSELGSGARALDYGCADRPYRLSLPAGVTYVGADLPGNSAADIQISEDGRVALPNASFDLVLSTQVLEHVETPDVYLSECSRLLRPGGWLLLSTHGIMYYHQDPEDYWRWTHAGLEKLVTGHGFEVVTSRGVLGLAAASLQILQDGVYWYVPRVLRWPFATFMQGLIVLADRFYPRVNGVSNCLTIALLARKPPRDAS